MMTAFEHLPRFRRIGDAKFTACCPGPNHSLNGTIRGNKLAIKCFSGCSSKEVLDAMGLDWPALFLDGQCRPNRDVLRRRRIGEVLQQWRQDEVTRTAKSLRNRDLLMT